MAGGTQPREKGLTTNGLPEALLPAGLGTLVQCMAASHLLPSSKAVQQASDWATPTSPICEKAASGHLTGTLWTAPTPTTRLLQHLSATDVPSGSTTHLSPPPVPPAKILGQGMALAAQHTAKGTSALTGRT